VATEMIIAPKSGHLFDLHPIQETNGEINPALNPTAEVCFNLRGHSAAMKEFLQSRHEDQAFSA
jgi:hypothetical protein